MIGKSTQVRSYLEAIALNAISEDDLPTDQVFTLDETTVLSAVALTSTIPDESTGVLIGETVELSTFNSDSTYNVQGHFPHVTTTADIAIILILEALSIDSDDEETITVLAVRTANVTALGGSATVDASFTWTSDNDNLNLRLRAGSIDTATSFTVGDMFGSAGLPYIRLIEFV